MKSTPIEEMQFNLFQILYNKIVGVLLVVQLDLSHRNLPEGLSLNKCNVVNSLHLHEICFSYSLVSEEEIVY